jgi:biopolymer transport protein ExbB/TolQ
MFVAILIGAVVVGVLLAGILAPILMVANKKKLKEMDQKISEFEARKFTTSEDREQAKQILKKELIKIKAGISQADKKAVVEAADKISIL